MSFMAAFVLLPSSLHHAQLHVPNEAVTDIGIEKPQTFSPANRLMLLKSLSPRQSLRKPLT
jgi:hypothetical protein